MAVVIPMAAAYFSIGAGVAAAAAAGTVMASIAAYAMIAGGVLTGLGALSGDKDISRIGAILSLGGGLGTAASKAATAANAAGGAEAAASGTVESLYGPTGAEAAPVVDGAAPFADVAAAAGDVAPAVGGIEDLGMAADLWGEAPTSMSDGATGGLFGMEQSAEGMPGASGWANEGAAAARSPVQEAAKTLTTDDISSFLKQAANKVGEGMKEVGPWIKENKEMVNLGGKALSAAYGPEAELVRLKKDQINHERSLMDRAYQNMNSPVKLYNYGKGT